MPAHQSFLGSRPHYELADEHTLICLWIYTPLGIGACLRSKYFEGLDPARKWRLPALGFF